VLSLLSVFITEQSVEISALWEIEDFFGSVHAKERLIIPVAILIRFLRNFSY
jgi:hypothetical protein